MPKTTLEPGAKVVYYAEGQPYKGPFAAVVDVVYPVEKDRKSEPPDLDLTVFFGEIDGKGHKKSRVSFSLEPSKHHWGWVPSDWPWPVAASAAPAETK